MKTKIIDNALSKDDFLKIKKELTSSEFPWYYSDFVARKDDIDDYYFIHLFYLNHHKNSNYFDLVLPILEVIKPKALIRIKGNLYPSTKELYHHKLHSDFTYDHQGAIFYLNTNDGYTILECGTKIESIENRILFFNASKPHSSTTCTDEKVRININFNYFG